MMSKTRVSQTNKEPSNPNRSCNTGSSLTKTRKITISPCCEPENHQQFLQRVQSYNSVKWFAKPSEINPLFCARFGWECIKVNTLQCTGCQSKITYKSNNKWNTNLNPSVIIESFKHNIQNAHCSSCPWINNVCSKSFELLPINDNDNKMKEQITKNIQTWIQRDNNDKYIVPQISETNKSLMISLINNNDNNNNTNEWFNPLYLSSGCSDIMLLSASGWFLNKLFTNNNNNNSSSSSPSIASITPYAQCRYCNRCISLQSYDYKKVLSLLPGSNTNTNTNNTNNTNNNTMDEDQDQHNNEDEEKDQFSASSILRKEFGINYSKRDGSTAVIEQLSQLNISRDHNMQIYETNTLLKPAQFRPDEISLNQENQRLNINNFGFGRSGFSLSGGFGSGSGNTGFREYGLNNMNRGNLRWPKESSLTQPSSRATSQSQSILNSVDNTYKKQTRIKNKNKKKRSRNQMVEDDGNNENELIKNDHNPPSKKIKINNENKNDLNSSQNSEVEKLKKNNKKRKNRKRKTMDEELEDNEDDDDDDDLQNELVIKQPNNKKRRISSVSNVSSVSTTLSLNNSESTSPSPSSSQSISPSKTLLINTSNQNKRKKSRKRKFNDLSDNENDDNPQEEEEEEDDDLKVNQNDDNKLNKNQYISHNRPSKRARLDSVIVRNQLFFDPINSHYNHCPFLIKHKNDIIGWIHCLKLIPKNIQYLKKLIHQKENE